MKRERKTYGFQMLAIRLDDESKMLAIRLDAESKLRELRLKHHLESITKEVTQ